MTEYKIEKGVPLPDYHKTGDERQKALRSMEVGDSLLIPMPMASCSGSLAHCRQKHPDRKFTARSVDGGTRVWRIE